jgi:Mg-chelatase subunit ChlD
MKQFLFILILIFTQYSYAQNSLQFENRKMYLGELEINTAYGINFSYENTSGKPIQLSYEPITNLVNATYKKETILPGEKGNLKINFYPEEEGPFNEQLYIIVNEKEKIELSIYGSVKTISKSYKSLTESNKLFGDRDIAFMVVDAQTFIGIPYAKVFIKNSTNNKSYIGVANKYGILVNRIPEGKYVVQALVDGYGKEVLDIKLDANRNIAFILLDKPEIKDTLPKKYVKENVVNQMKDSIISQPLQDSVDILAEVKEVNHKAPYYDPNPSIPAEIIAKKTVVEKSQVEKSEESVRKTLNLILLIDVSKSMEKPNRIGVLKKSIIHLINNYQAQDYMAILTFNDDVNELMERSQISNKEKCINQVNSILPSGNTDGVLGIDKAFEILKRNYMPDAINMVILASDGKMNKYAYDDKTMLEKIEKMNESGILTSVVGFGTSQNYKAKLSQIAELGGGVYIDMNLDTENIEHILLDDIYSTLLQVK